MNKLKQRGRFQTISKGVRINEGGRGGRGGRGGKGWGTRYDDLYGEAPPERGTFSRLQVY